MDYFQGTVETYLRADRALFLNTEYLLQLDPDMAVPKKGRHWYVDILAMDLKRETVWLCEVTYSQTLSPLFKRLAAWHENWTELRFALQRDSHISADFDVRPWVFIPQDKIELFNKKFALALEQGNMPKPRISQMEDVLPWKYQTWNRRELTNGLGEKL